MGVIDDWTLPLPEIRVPTDLPAGSAHGSANAGSARSARPFPWPAKLPQNYLLIREDRVWMSLSPVECESLAPHSPAYTGML